MHYVSHILLNCIALWCAINGGKAARSAVSPDILANFAKNVASVLSPVILGDVQSRINRSSFPSILTIPTNLNGLNSRSILDNMVDKTSKTATYFESRPYPYNGLYEDSAEGLERSEANKQLDGSLRDGSYLRQEQSNFYRPYNFPPNNGNPDAAPRPSDNIDSSIDNIQESPTSLYPSYHGGGFPKAAFAHGPFLGKPYGGFYGGFGPYGPHHHHHHHHHPYGSSEEVSSEDYANNGTNRDYGSPYFGHHPYSPYGGYGHSFYGPDQRNGNDSSGNGHNGHYGYGPYGGYGGYGGPDFYGPPGYGHGYGYNRGSNGNNNGNNNNNDNTNARQTEGTTESGDQNNSTKNGYSPHYGPPLVKPLLGTFHPHGFPFHPLPYDHFHGLFKGGPVVGVGHVGYPIYADPYLAGFPFHPYGPFIHGKKYLPKGKPADSGGETTTAAPAELTENEAPERITALNNEEVAPAPSSNRYKTSGLKELKRLINLVNSETRRV